jgi:hypothetical protein
VRVDAALPPTPPTRAMKNPTFFLSSSSTIGDTGAIYMGVSQIEGKREKERKNRVKRGRKEKRDEKQEIGERKGYMSSNLSQSIPEGDRGRLVRREESSTNKRSVISWR